MRIFRLLPGIFLFSAATLCYEINLTRLFATAQFYHFAFLIVSIALLGFGASGSALAAFPKFPFTSVRQLLVWASLGIAISIVGSYIFVNWLPFDSYSIAWDRRQSGLLVLHFLALSTPFFFCGLVVGLLLTYLPGQTNLIYAANLSGSALGSLVALFAPVYVGGEGMVVLATLIAALPALLYLSDPFDPPSSQPSNQPLKSIWKGSGKNPGWTHTRLKIVQSCIGLLIITFCSAELYSRLQGKSYFTFLELRLSPYKNLSYAMQYPDAENIFQRWNSYSRVDLVRSSGIRSFPGMSFNFREALPAQDGLFVDGDDLSPVVREGENRGFTNALPASLAYQLKPAARVLVLEPRGGQDILTAIAGGAQAIIAVEPNSLVVKAAAPMYDFPQVKVINTSGRAYSKSSSEFFDIAILSLVSSFHPVRSGAYSLAEDYRYTGEAFQDYLRRLEPDGILIFTRWMQSPPSESLRAFALALTALELQGGNPENQIAAFRSYNTITLLIKNEPFTALEISKIRNFTGKSSYDLVYLPGLEEGETNQYNILPKPDDFLAFKDLENSPDRNAYYRNYPFAVDPPTDDHPFFGHYFRWSQAPQILGELGKTWQPFGGAGYFIILALLMIAICLSGLLILLPAWITHQRRKRMHENIQMNSRLPVRFPVYFGLLGLAFLLVEIPLMQNFILYLGNQSYSFALVVFCLLAFSGVGSLLSTRIRFPAGLALTAIYVVLLQAYKPILITSTLGLPIGARMLLVIIMLAPLGLCMGTAFPGGIQWMVKRPEMQVWIPWIWAINGSTSVISAILAALLALSFGFNLVLQLGMFCYLVAWLIVMVSERQSLAGFLPH